MSNKFDEVSTDIIEKIFQLKYEDSEKEMIKKIILYNLFHMTRSEKIFEKSVRTLKLADEINTKNQ